MACRLHLGTVWINKVGTYGMGSASYWWSRAAAAILVRLVHAVLGGEVPIEILLYVDDEKLGASCQRGIELCGFTVYLLTVLGVPWAWHKFRGGEAVSWVGLWTDGKLYQIGLSEGRAAWVRNWLLVQLKDGSVDLQEFAGVLGRLSFAAGAVDYVRPFIAALFACVSQRGYRGRVPLPWSVRFLFRVQFDNFSEDKRTVEVHPQGPSLGEAFRADAKAEGQTVVVGGWECLNGVPPSRARWFSVHLDRKCAPWAFARGDPFRSIGAFELFATFLCVMAFADDWPVMASGQISVTGPLTTAGILLYAASS